MERFIEMPVIGALLLLSLAPLQAIKYGWSGTYARIARALRSPARVGLLLGIAFVVGVVGNQLVDETFIRLEKMFKDGAKKKATARQITGATANSFETPKRERWSRDAVEYELGGKNEYVRAYFERHRLFLRIDRAGAVSMALLLVTLLVYRTWKRDWVLLPVEIVVLVLGLAFYAAYATERDAMKHMVKDLRVTLTCT